MANSFTLGGELVVSSREQGANFHVHLNQQQQQQPQQLQLQLQPLPQSLSQSSASEVSTRSSPASPNSTISLAPQILRIPSRPFQQQTRQNLLRQSDLPLHYPISGKTSGPNASNITGSIASTISGSRKSSISVDISPPPLLPVFPTSGPTLPTLLPEPLPRNDFDFAPKFFPAPGGKSNMAFGVTTVYDADESMVMNVNQIEERWGTGIKLAKLRNVPNIQNRSSSSSSTLIKVNKRTIEEVIKMITNSKAKKYFALAFKYFDRPILCYLIPRGKVIKLYEEICAHKNDLATIEDILGLYPTNQFISIELIAALIASGALYDDNIDCVREYLTLLKTEMFINNSGCLVFNESSYPKLQAMLVCALLELGLGELTTAWELSGIALRMGIDLGFDSFIYDGSDKEIDNLRNLVFWGSYIIDKYAGLIFGRITMLYVDNSVPLIFLPNRQGKLPCLAQLIIDTQPMISSIYETIPETKNDPEMSKKIFLERYNLLQGYNKSLGAWKRGLSREYFWNKSILINTITDESVDHLLKIAYYLIFLIMNKPFLKLPIGSDIDTFIEIVDEMEIIMRYIPDDKHLLNLVVYYALVLMIQSLVAQVSYTNANNYTQNSKFMNQLLFFIDRMGEVLRVDIWLICKKVHSNFQQKVEYLEKLMLDLTEKMEQRRRDEENLMMQQEEFYAQQQQQQQQQQPKHEYHDHQQEQEQQEQLQEEHSEKDIEIEIKDEPQPQEEHIHQDYPMKEEEENLNQLSEPQTNEEDNPAEDMLQNEQFMRMVDILFIRGIENDQEEGEEQQQQQQQQEQVQQEQVQQEQVQQEQVQQDQMELEEDELPQQMPTPPEQPDEPEIPQLPEILDPTFFNSIVDNNGSTFNNIFSFDTEGFRL